MNPIFNFFICIALFLLAIIVLKLMLPRYISGGYPFVFIIYSYTTVLISILTLEFGFYITESENYSYLNGAAISYVVLFFSAGIVLVISLRLISSLKLSRPKKIISKSVSQKIITFLIFISGFYLSLGYINVLTSPNSLLVADVNRFNFWENSRFPWLANIIGERGMAIALFLGCVNNLKSYNGIKVVNFLFGAYLFYLILLGHRFSPLLLAIFFYFLPVGLSRNIKSSLALKYALFIVPPLLLYVIYLYSNITSGIVEANGGAIGGVLYRTGILQGQVYWNSWSIFLENKNTLNNLVALINNGFDGLEMAMYVVSPNNAYDYISQGVRFTAAYPAFVLLIGFWFALMFMFISMVLYAFIIYRAYNLAKIHSVFRLYLYITLLYFYHFALTMGDFRSFFSFKLIFISFAILILENLPRFSSSNASSV